MEQQIKHYNTEIMPNKKICTNMNSIFEHLKQEHLRLTEKYVMFTRMGTKPQPTLTSMIDCFLTQFII
jgi:hypothetical protein